MWTRDVARQYPKARIAVQMIAAEPMYKAQRILRPDIAFAHQILEASSLSPGAGFEAPAVAWLTSDDDTARRHALRRGAALDG